MNRFLVAAVVIFTYASGYCSQTAFDSAADSAYNGGWTQGSNGGFGWGGGWNIIGLPGWAIIGSSASNGSGDADGDGDINSPRAIGGRAWGFGGGAIRTFSGPLSLGQTFSLDFDDYGGVSVNFYSSVDLLAPDGSTAVTFLANTSLNRHYLVENANGSLRIDSGVTETDEGLHLAFTQLLSGIDVSITPYLSGATTRTISVPFTGQLQAVEVASSIGTPSTFLETYINNIAITPEPASLGLIPSVLIATLLRRRRPGEAARQ